MYIHPNYLDSFTSLHLNKLHNLTTRVIFLLPENLVENLVAKHLKHRYRRKLQYILLDRRKNVVLPCFSFFNAIFKEAEIKGARVESKLRDEKQRLF